jgi:hypothetical protein
VSCLYRLSFCLTVDIKVHPDHGFQSAVSKMHGLHFDCPRSLVYWCMVGIAYRVQTRGMPSSNV